jgi:hypothetical protein
MKASEARALTAQYDNVNNADIEALYEKICNRIRAAAQRGKNSIKDPFYDLGGPHLGGMPTVEQLATLRQRLINDGYRVEYHPDSDPGYPFSKAYTTVSW